MNEKMKENYYFNLGFDEFVDLHGLVAGDPETRVAYDRWLIERMFLADEFAEIRAEGEAEGEAKGEAKGRAEALMEIALNAFRTAKPDTDPQYVAKKLKRLGLPEDVIETARSQIK